MFVSKYSRPLKLWRVSIPEDYREELGDNFMLTPSIDGKPCLAGYNKQRFEDIFETLDRNGIDTSLLTADAAKVLCDSQGRITIPQDLRDEKEGTPFTDSVMIVGAGPHIEIWSVADYEASRKNPEAANLERAEIGKKYKDLKRQAQP
ncbi:MAG: hypothetical protein LBT36_02590 [Oscillospiraceae bacterium]|nr:hypothetical protein [Oscillospiraceae bacterium]